MAAGLFKKPFASRLTDRPPIPSLDGLRAISIAFVVFAHLSGTQFFPSFVISGFLITTLLLEELAARGRISLKRFYLRRAFRILPAKYFYLALILLGVVAGLYHVDANDFLYAVTYTANYDYDRSWYMMHLWSLAVEEQFYLLWPAVLCCAGRKRAMWAAAGVMAVSPVLRTIALHWRPQAAWPIGASFQSNADALATGCLLAGTRAWLGGREWYRRFLDSRAFVLGPLAALAACLAQPLAAFHETMGATLMNVAIALTIDRCVRRPEDSAGRFLNQPAVAYAGVLSYSTYLWQQPFLNRLGTSAWNAFPVNLLFVAAASMASYHLVEKPFLRMRRRIESRLFGSRPGPEKEAPVPVTASEAASLPRSSRPQSQPALPDPRI